MKKKTLEQVAEFSYTKTVLSIDETIKWLEERLAMEDAPKDVPPKLLEFLGKMRKECADAVHTKPFHWD